MPVTEEKLDPFMITGVSPPQKLDVDIPPM
jgi:hypothetical protein